jgi:hypothetical protein
MKEFPSTGQAFHSTCLGAAEVVFTRNVQHGCLNHVDNATSNKMASPLQYISALCLESRAEAAHATHMHGCFVNDISPKVLHLAFMMSMRSNETGTTCLRNIPVPFACEGRNDFHGTGGCSVNHQQTHKFLFIYRCMSRLPFEQAEKGWANARCPHNHTRKMYIKRPDK